MIIFQSLDYQGITQNAVGKSTLPSCRLLLKWSLMKRIKKVPRARKGNFPIIYGTRRV
jgi:hypothetical protein